MLQNTCSTRFRLCTLLSCVAAAVTLYRLSLTTERTYAADAKNKSRLKTESFDYDPGWAGVNNRLAQSLEPVSIRQEFGYNPDTAHAGGEPGEIGGFITAAGEAAFYGKPLEQCDLEQPLSASGTMLIEPGGTHLLLGFFNSTTVNEWRTPNTLALRINGRGEKFFAYVEYCTAKWRAGGDSTPFPSTTDPKTGRWNLTGYPCNKVLKWTLNYDPLANDGNGTITATIDQDTAICKLDKSHKSDGAIFNRFGMLNVMKSADNGSNVWFDDITVNGSAKESFERDPGWDGQHNRATHASRLVRPRFDFGYTLTQHAGGKARGELGGRIFRGDCRYADRLASYGDRVGPLSLNRPLYASGKVTLARGVSDSTTLFGFYHSQHSLRRNDSQSDGVPECVLGIHIEGPSSEGFKFYPVFRATSGGGSFGNARESPTIYPDGKSHDWSLEYDPDFAQGKGRIVVKLDGKSSILELSDGAKKTATFDRFGIVTSWIDGNSQDVFWDDITYTVMQE